MQTSDIKDVDYRLSWIIDLCAAAHGTLGGVDCVHSTCFF